jgi:hypothetical protein
MGFLANSIEDILFLWEAMENVDITEIKNGRED